MHLVLSACAIRVRAMTFFTFLLFAMVSTAFITLAPLTLMPLIEHFAGDVTIAMSCSNRGWATASQVVCGLI